MNLDPGRQSFGNLRLLEVYVDGNKPMARLRCKCGNEPKVQLSRWRNQPPRNCLPCTIKNNRLLGPGLLKNVKDRVKPQPGIKSTPTDV